MWGQDQGYGGTPVWVYTSPSLEKRQSPWPSLSLTVWDSGDWAEPEQSLSHTHSHTGHSHTHSHSHTAKFSSVSYIYIHNIYILFGLCKSKQTFPIKINKYIHKKSHTSHTALPTRQHHSLQHAAQHTRLVVLVVTRLVVLSRATYSTSTIRKDLCRGGRGFVCVINVWWNQVCHPVFTNTFVRKFVRCIQIIRVWVPD